MDGANGDRALADSPGDAFDRAVADVADREHARQARFERQGRMFQRPRLRRDVAAGQDEATIVQSEVAEPFGPWLGANHDEDDDGGDPFAPAGPGVFERQGFQAGLAVAVGDPGAGPDVDVGCRP